MDENITKIENVTDKSQETLLNCAVYEKSIKDKLDDLLSQRKSLTNSRQIKESIIKCICASSLSACGAALTFWGTVTFLGHGSFVTNMALYSTFGILTAISYVQYLSKTKDLRKLERTTTVTDLDSKINNLENNLEEAKNLKNAVIDVIHEIAEKTKGDRIDAEDIYNYIDYALAEAEQENNAIIEGIEKTYPVIGEDKPLIRIRKNKQD